MQGCWGQRGGRFSAAARRRRLGVTLSAAVGARMRAAGGVSRAIKARPSPGDHAGRFTHIRILAMAGARNSPTNIAWEALEPLWAASRGPAPDCARRACASAGTPATPSTRARDVGYYLRPLLLLDALLRALLLHRCSVQ